VQLKSNPNWQLAASQLILGCEILSQMSDRLALIEKLATSLGDSLYPAFIQILCVVNTTPSQQGKKRLTEALVQAISTGRLPTGQLSAWGLTSVSENSACGQKRSLGPIEYLCVWYAQPSGRSPLSEHSFRAGLQHLMSLIDLDDDARQLYCEKLSSEIECPMGGALSSATRSAMAQLVDSWQSGQCVIKSVNNFLDELARVGQAKLQHPSCSIFTNPSLYSR